MSTEKEPRTFRSPPVEGQVHRFMLRLPQNLWVAIGRQAATHSQSINSRIVQLIEQDTEAAEADEPEPACLYPSNVETIWEHVRAAGKRAA